MVGQVIEKKSDVEIARKKWLEASEHAEKLARDMYPEGGGYGDPQAEVAERYKVDVAKSNAERLMREYHDIDRRSMETKILELQQSQKLATWASLPRFHIKCNS